MEKEKIILFYSILEKENKAFCFLVNKMYQNTNYIPVSNKLNVTKTVAVSHLKHSTQR